MRKWREVFGISQIDLARQLKISPSTISDYESNRRKSPGIGVIRRLIDALFALDATRGGEVAKRFSEAEHPLSDFFQAIDFPKAMSGEKFAQAIDATILAGKEKLSSVDIFGCTILDSVKVILDLPYESFIKLYSTTTQRALVFTNVATGRSTMVAIRMAPIKPALVVLHDVPGEPDRLAVKIAERESLPLLVTKMSIEDMKKKLGGA